MKEQKLVLWGYGLEEYKEMFALQAEDLQGPILELGAGASTFNDNLTEKFRNYLENYSFEQEIETMAPLYQDDMHRVKNMRLKILESFDENKITDDIKEFMDKI